MLRYLSETERAAFMVASSEFMFVGSYVERNMIGVTCQSDTDPWTHQMKRMCSAESRPHRFW